MATNGVTYEIDIPAVIIPPSIDLPGARVCQFHPHNNNFFAIGGLEGAINFWSRSGLLRTISYPQFSDDTRWMVTGIRFNHDGTKICHYSNGYTFIHDVETGHMDHQWMRMIDEHHVCKSNTRHPIIWKDDLIFGVINEGDTISFYDQRCSSNTTYMTFKERGLDRFKINDLAFIDRTWPISLGNYSMLVATDDGRCRVFDICKRNYFFERYIIPSLPNVKSVLPSPGPYADNFTANPTSFTVASSDTITTVNIPKYHLQHEIFQRENFQNIDSYRNGICIAEPIITRAVFSSNGMKMHVSTKEGTVLTFDRYNGIWDSNYRCSMKIPYLEFIDLDVSFDSQQVVATSSDGHIASKYIGNFQPYFCN